MADRANEEKIISRLILIMFGLRAATNTQFATNATDLVWGGVKEIDSKI
ncbi:MAG: hypothetical protein HWD62_10440 [Cyclobacteriaceae bacterium]|nr:MAG: hypothetical protein HWD62_10440 [Cyclobacteriaceae bacterium]